MGGVSSSTTYLTIKNETNTDIITCVSDYRDEDWSGWDCPRNQLENWRIPARSEDKRSLQVVNDVRPLWKKIIFFPTWLSSWETDAPYKLTLNFDDGTKDVLFIKQIWATGKGNMSHFQHQHINHDCTLRKDDNTLRVGMKMTGQQLQADSQKQEAKQLVQQGRLAEALTKIRRACELNARDSEIGALKFKIVSQCKAFVVRLFNSGFDKEEAGQCANANADFNAGLKLAQVLGEDDNENLREGFRSKLQSNELFNRTVRREDGLLNLKAKLMGSSANLEQWDKLKVEYNRVISDYVQCEHLLRLRLNVNKNFARNVELVHSAAEAAREELKKIDEKCLEVRMKQLNTKQNNVTVERNETHQKLNYYRVLE